MDCEENIDDGTVNQKKGDRPIISLHALTRTIGYRIMRVQGKIKNQLVSILVDTGSTHNFVNQRVIKKIGVQL